MASYLAKLLRQWLDQHPEQNESDFAREAKLSKSLVNNVKNGKAGAGSKTVAGWARVLGKTTTQLHAEANGEAYGSAKRLKFSDLPEWQEAVAEARRTPRGKRIAEVAWTAAATTGSDVAQPRTIDALTALQFAELWESVLAPPDSTPKAS